MPHDHSTPTPQIKQLVRALRDALAAATDLIEQLDAPQQARIATANHNPAGNPSTFRRFVREGRVAAWKVGRQLACDWSEFEQALRADGYQPRATTSDQDPALNDDPQMAALDALAEGE